MKKIIVLVFMATVLILSAKLPKSFARAQQGKLESTMVAGCCDYKAPNV